MTRPKKSFSAKTDNELVDHENHNNIYNVADIYEQLSSGYTSVCHDDDTFKEIVLLCIHSIRPKARQTVKFVIFISKLLLVFVRGGSTSTPIDCM